jgi:signal transduction histidine kinase
VSGRLRLYVSAVLLAAATAMALALPTEYAGGWAHLVAWVVICLVSDSMWSANLSGQGTWSLSATAGLSAVVLWGSEAGLWIAAVSTLLGEIFVLRKPWVRAAFNAGQTGLAALGAGLVFDALGGRLALPLGVGGATLERGTATALVLPFVGLTLAYWALNRSLVSLAVAWSSDRNWWRVMREDWLYVARLEVDAASFLLAPLMVISYLSVGYPGVLLFYAPLFMLFQSDRRFVDLKRAEEQNLRAARFAAKGELAAGIGHELNNQLVAITARAQMLLKDAEKQRFENAPRHAQIILDQSKRMGALAKGLMDYTRNTIDAEPMDLNSLLANTIEFVRGDKRFRGVEWEVHLDPSLPELKADVGQIQGVFINLFVNAADAMGAQDGRRAISVTTRLEPRSQKAQVVVSDTGPGIRPEHLPRMFEFMFTTKDQGHGFGLSTSHRTVENHGGHITVESPEGSGAVFTVELPLLTTGARR